MARSNGGSDIHYADGAWGGALPAVYGHGAAGTVTEIGDKVRDIAAGDRVPTAQDNANSAGG